MEGPEDIEKALREFLEAEGIDPAAFLAEKEAVMARKAELDARLEAASVPIPPRPTEIG